MRMVRAISGVAAGAVMVLVMSAPVASAASNTYSGVFSGKVQYSGCTSPQPHDNVASGTWSVTTHGSSASGTFTILVNGAPHVSYTANGMRNVYSTAPVYFVVTVQTLAGPETVTLYKTGDMTYVIAPYDYDGVTCQSVTYPGSGGPVG